MNLLLLLSSITWTGKMKINQSSIQGLFSREAKCLLALKMKKGQNACLLGWQLFSYRLFYTRCMTPHNSYILKENIFNPVLLPLSIHDSSGLGYSGKAKRKWKKNPISCTICKKKLKEMIFFHTPSQILLFSSFHWHASFKKLCCSVKMKS